MIVKVETLNIPGDHDVFLVSYIWYGITYGYLRRSGWSFQMHWHFPGFEMRLERC